MSSFNSYPSIFNLGHKAVSTLLDGLVIVEEKVDGCIGINELVLTTDLRWVPACDLVVGQALVGLEYEKDRLRLHPTCITTAIPIQKSCVKVITDKTTILVSCDHPFWVRGKHPPNSGSGKWLRADQLRSGHTIPYIPPWKEDLSWEAGYLSGQFDGEGSLVRHGDERILSYYQRVSPSQELVKELLIDRGFQLREDIRQRRANYSQVWTGIIAGGWGEVLRFLGSIRPQRLLEKSQLCWDGGAVNGLDSAVVTSIEAVGNQWVMGLSTDIGGYWGGGFASHNSQFSFGIIDGEFRCRSKGKEMVPDAPEGMFKAAIDFVKKLDLHPGWTYRGEVLSKPKHNALAYSRVPIGNVILFDVCVDEESYLLSSEKEYEAKRLGLECVPLLYAGKVESAEFLKSFLDTESILGGQSIEGVVIKPLNYNVYGQDKKVLMGKFVSEKYKEVHKETWGENNPGGKDIVERLVSRYGTRQRWQKAIQHLRDDGLIEDSPKDIGVLLKEVVADVRKEEEEEIKEVLFNWAWPQISRGLVRGLPEWYKDLLLDKQFEKGES